MSLSASLNQVFYCTEACMPRARGAMFVLLEVAIAGPSSNFVSEAVGFGICFRVCLLLLLLVAVVFVSAAAVVMSE